MSSRLRSYLYALQHDPPLVFVRKARNLIWRIASSWIRRTIDRLGFTHLSDSAFRAALKPELSSPSLLIEHLRSKNAAWFSHRLPTNDFNSDYRRATVKAADDACNHIYDLLGSGPVNLGKEIDWHTDFKSSHRYSPRAYYADIRPASYPGGHDIKVPWELSRCQHLIWMGQAYTFTGDEKYAEEFVAQVNSWIYANPPRFGANWVCTMDVAIRAVNWLWAVQIFKQSTVVTDNFLLKFSKSLWEHGRHIMTNLEWSDEVTANHYLSDVVGLVYLGIMCPFFKEADQWREFGLQELWREMNKQVYEDGVDFEASISYHRLALELFLSPIVLCKLNDIDVPVWVMARLEKMLEFVMHYTKPDGTVPLFGDCDNGRLHRLKVWAEPDREWVDHRYLLAIGAVLFDRTDFGVAAGDQWEEAFWMWGEQAIRFKEELSKRVNGQLELSSIAFDKGGIYIMRGASTYVAVDAGTNGQNGSGGHAHNDTLSFEYFAHGQSWIVDPGVYVYTADFEARNLFRSSLVHNSLSINGVEINQFNKEHLFSMPNDTQPTIHHWQAEGPVVEFLASHNGYERLAPPVSYNRQFQFDTTSGTLIVHDRVQSTGDHAYQLLLQLMPVEVKINGNLAYLQTAGAGLALGMWSSALNSGLTAGSGSIARGYGSRVSAPTLIFSGRAAGEFSVTSILVPYKGTVMPNDELLSGLYQRYLETY